MPITALDYQLTDFWTYDSSVECINIYYFRNVGGTASAEDLVLAFIANLAPLISDISASVMLENKVEAYNLVTTTDFHSNPASGVGTVSGAAAPSFQAHYYPILRSDRSFRSSGKRYAGVPEAWTNNNEYGVSGATERAALQSALDQPFTGSTGTYQLMMPKRVKTANPDPPPTFTYVLSDLSVPAGVGFPRISTQNSRKVRD